MSTQEPKDRLELLQGTPEVLIPRTPMFGSQPGQTSEDQLLVEHGALYPALTGKAGMGLGHTGNFS